MSISVLNDDREGHPFRLRVTRNSKDRTVLEEFQRQAKDELGVIGRIQGPYRSDRRYRLQYYGVDAMIWAKATGWYETDQGKNYRALKLEHEAMWGVNWVSAGKRLKKLTGINPFYGSNE